MSFILDALKPLEVDLHRPAAREDRQRFQSLNDPDYGYER